jgi:hypothetical protein
LLGSKDVKTIIKSGQIKRFQTKDGSALARLTNQARTIALAHCMFQLTHKLRTVKSLVKPTNQLKLKPILLPNEKS